MENDKQPWWWGLVLTTRASEKGNKMAKVIPKRKIKIVESTRAKAGGIPQQVQAGKSYDIDAPDAKILVEMGKAKYVGTGDPKVRPVQKQLPGAKRKGPDSPDPQAVIEVPHGIIIPDDVSEALMVNGLDTLEKIIEATDEELLAIHGVGPATLADLRTLAQLTLDVQAQQDPTVETPDEPGEGGQGPKTET